jgi:hypothetical protein
MRALARTLIAVVVIVLSGTMVQALPHVCWVGSAIGAVGDVYDAPNGNLIGSIDDDKRSLVVDHWEGDWALFTSPVEPSVGWIKGSSVTRRLNTLTCVPTRPVDD